MKTTRLVAAGLALASLGLSVGASAQGWGAGQRRGPAAVADRDAPPPRPDDRRFYDRGFDGRNASGRGFDGADFDRRGGDPRFDDRRLDDRRFDDRRFDGQRFDGRRFTDRGRGVSPERRWGRDDRHGYRGGNRCWIEHRRDGRVTVCR